jgi:hypothetical protein
MATRMQQRRGTEAQWISTNSGNGPVLNAGEIGFESDTNKFKIGDGVNHWVDLNYFTDAEGALAEVTALIDGAPAALNTLNELAAAINDDPTFFTTIATNLSNHQSDTTDIHGIADTSLLATKSYADTAEADAITAAGTAADTKISNAVAALTKSSVGLENVDNTSDADKPVSTATQTALDAKASDTDLSDHTSATTNVHGILDTDELATKEYVTTEIGNSTVDQSVLAGEGIDWNGSTEQFDIDSTVVATLTGTQTLTNKTVALGSNTVSGTIAEFNTAVTDADLATLAGTETLTNKTLTSPVINTPTGITKSDVGLENVDNTSDANKPVSTATQTELDAKLASATAATTYAPLDSPALTGTPTAPTATAGTNSTQVATTAYADAAVAALVDAAPETLNTLNELAAALGDDASFSTTVSTSIGLKAPLESPTFTGTVAGITKSMVGLGDVDNTADSAKPVSTATQTALDLKSPAASPTFTGTVTLPQGKLTGGSTTVSANTATTVSTVALADFTTMEYTVSIKQGSKVRSSKVLVQTDGTTVDSVEHSILETGGAMTGINVTAAVSSTNAILTVTITDASSTNAAVKVINTII